MSKGNLSEKVLNLLCETEIISSQERLLENHSEQIGFLRNALTDMAQNYSSKEDIEQLQVVIDEAPCTISWINSDCTYIGVNKVMSELCEHPQEAFVGQRVGFYTNETHFLEFVQDLFDSPKERIHQELEATINDIPKWYYIVGRKYNQGKEAVLIGLDISKQKFIEQNMILREKMATLGELSASIVHEINNPLTVFNFCSERLKLIQCADNEATEQLFGLIDKLDKNTKRISRIVNNLKKFSRSNPEEMNEEFSIATVIQDSIEICNKKIMDSRVKVSVDCPEHLNFYGNEIEFSQVLVNLISNASDAMENSEERWIKVLCQEDDKTIIIKVIDSGPGIPEKHRNSILRPFFTTKDKDKGTGLGLSISRTIVEKHSGKISLVDEEGHTCFKMIFKKSATKSHAA